MRVWALASCGGLLALAACSAEQSSSPHQGGAPPDGDDAAQVKAQPEFRVTPSSPLARPEVGPRQVLRRPTVKSAPLVKGPEGQTLAQSAQLRARLQRLRAQQGSRLASNTSLVTAPLPATLTQRPPTPQPTQFDRATSAGEQAPAAVAVGAVQTAGVRPSATAPLPPQPSPGLSPQAAAIAPRGTVADLGPLAAASLARSYPIAPLRHQGYSARSQRPDPVLTVSTADLSDRAAAPVAAAAPRLHGETAANLQTQPAVVAATPQPSATTPRVADAAQPRREIEPGVANHVDSTVAITLDPSSESSLSGASGDHHSQAVEPRLERPLETSPTEPGELAGAETAIAPPESLPLASPSPQLSQPRPLGTESGALARPQPVFSPGSSPAAAPPTTAAHQGVGTPMATPLAAPPPAAPTAPSTQHLGQHLGQLSSAPMHLAPSRAEAPKGLSAACLLTRGISPTPEVDTEATAPQFSGAGITDTSLSPGADLEKQDLTPDLCPGDGVPASGPGLEMAPALSE